MAHIVMADDGIPFDGTSIETGPLGGAETAFVALAEALAARGHRVEARSKCRAPVAHNGVVWAPLASDAPDRCDLLIAKEGATFGTPEINVGAFPYMIMAIIYRNVPRKKVNEMMLLGERLSAGQAVEYGLANKVVPAGEFDAAVADWAAKLASKSPVLMRLGHDAMYRQQDMAVDDALEFLRSQLSLTFSTEDIVEGVSAFFEKRDPQWKGR